MGNTQATLLVDCKNKYKVAAQIGITIKEGAQNNNTYTLGVAVYEPQKYAYTRHSPNPSAAPSCSHCSATKQLHPDFKVLPLFLYSFLKKNPKYKTPAKFTAGFVEIFVGLLRYFTNRSDPEREGTANFRFYLHFHV
jgi:hypothetical protein